MAMMRVAVRRDVADGGGDGDGGVNGSSSGVVPRAWRHGGELPHVWRLAGIGGEEDSRFRLGPDPARP